MFVLVTFSSAGGIGPEADKLLKFSTRKKSDRGILNYPREIRQLLAKICCQAKKHKTTRINEVQEALSDDEIAFLQVEAEDVEIFQEQSYEGPSISVKLNNQSFVMDYDMGAAISTLPATIWRNRMSQLKKSSVVKRFGGYRIQTLGSCNLRV
ncbi:hypothetical protein GJ496_008464 [Pomphorhynchus laevis]|nr:hypothetical protein GJ496_008464 [Pomphorhynchus laevis]